MTEVQCLQKADEWDFLLYVWKVEKTNEQKLGNRKVEILISPNKHHEKRIWIR